MKVITKIRFVL